MARNLSKDTSPREDAAKLRNLLRKAMPAVLQKLYDMALAGDVQAAKLLLDRTIPTLSPVKEPVAFFGDTRKAMALDIMDKVAAGQIEARDALVLFEVLEAAPREAKDATLAQGKGVSAETIMMVRREILGIQP